MCHSSNYNNDVRDGAQYGDTCAPATLNGKNDRKPPNNKGPFKSGMGEFEQQEQDHKSNRAEKGERPEETGVSA